MSTVSVKLVDVGTLIGSNEAADILGVSRPTLYAYVSRGRLGRTTAPDGRTSLFDRDEVEQLSERSRHSTAGPRPTIDVQIRSDVTTMHETALEFRGHDVATLVRDRHFEDVAELLWSGRGADAPRGTTWPKADAADLDAISSLRTVAATPIGRLAIAAHTLGALRPDDDARIAAQRLLLVAPALFGSRRRTGSYATRLASAWRRDPPDAMVGAIDTALVLLADHELATSTLAVRIAASARTSPSAAFAAGLASIEGHLHGSAASAVHRFLDDCSEVGPACAVADLRALRRGAPGFGHLVYRGVDPRVEPLLDAMSQLDRDGRARSLLDDTIREVGRTFALQPNIDLALGALTRTAGLAHDTPIFAVARIAGWAAHYDEELDEAPLRFRGVARPR